jgi:hypothetical protein
MELDNNNEKKTLGPGIVVHVYNPSYSEGRGRSVVVRPVPGKKCKTLSKKVTKQKRGVGMVQVV